MPFPFWPPDSAADTRAIRDRVIDQEGGTFELVVMRKDGTCFEAEITAVAARHPDGGHLGFVNTLRDVSERKRHDPELQRLARHDALTGLPNQRSFWEQLAQDTARAKRHGRPLSIAVIDIDHFKRVNDAHGHLTGDAVLREVCDRLQRLVRDGEHLARVGGEEFAWILPDAPEEGALVAAERARRAVGERPFPGVGTVTLSVGVCELGDAPDGDAGDLYARADAALYEAKRRGRDRSCAHAMVSVQAAATV